MRTSFDAVKLPADLDNPSQNGRLLPCQLASIEGGQIHRVALAAWQSIVVRAGKDGLRLAACPSAGGGYQSYEQQVSLFKNSHTIDPSLGSAPKHWNGQMWYLKLGQTGFAVPGTSIFGWGLAIAVTDRPRDHRLRDWLIKHAHSHGWRCAFDAEPAHLLFVPSDAPTNFCGASTNALNPVTADVPSANRNDAGTPGLNDWDTMSKELLLAADQVQAALLKLTKTEPARLAHFVATTRRRTPDRYHVLATSLAKILPRSRTPSALERTALQLACQSFDGSAIDASEKLAALLSKRWPSQLCTFFRSHFTDNAEALLRLLTAYLDRELKTPLNALGQFNLVALAYAYASDEQYDQLLSHLRNVHQNARDNDNRTAEKSLYRIATAHVPTCAHAKSESRADSPKRLRIALCISGQMRAFRRAWPTWKHLGYFEHEVDIYVHTWRSVGWRFPNPQTGNGASRAFDHAPFREAYLRCGSLYGTQAMWDAYPGFMKSLKRECGEVNEADLRAVYGDQAALVIEDDPGAEFGPDLNNQRKMFYKIAAAHAMARESGRTYDLIVRQRPDLAARPPVGEIDLRAVANASRSERSLFGAEAAYITNSMYVDDQFALGTPEVMDDYARTLAIHAQATEEKWFCFTPHLAPHLTLAQSLLFQGIRFKRFPHARLGPIVGEEAMSRETIRTLLMCDIGEKPRDRMDRILLDALA